jgi:type IV pilus assembly protein PilV
MKIPPKMQRGTGRSAARRSQAGVMLIEALVAILIFTLGIVAVMGLQANSIIQVSQAKYRTDAAYLANQIIGKMWVDQANLSAYVGTGYAGRSPWDTQVAATLPQGAGTIAVVGSLVTVTITWKQPEDVVTHKQVAVANLNVS